MPFARISAIDGPVQRKSPGASLRGDEPSRNPLASQNLSIAWTTPSFRDTTLSLRDELTSNFP
jgi:hypothetical protein